MQIDITKNEHWLIIECNKLSKCCLIDKIQILGKVAIFHFHKKTFYSATHRATVREWFMFFMLKKGRKFFQFFSSLKRSFFFSEMRFLSDGTKRNLWVFPTSRIKYDAINIISQAHSVWLLCELCVKRGWKFWNAWLWHFISVAFFSLEFFRLTLEKKDEKFQKWKFLSSSIVVLCQ
jgi:hypothetical protein